MKNKTTNTFILSVSVSAVLGFALLATGCASTGRSIRDFITGNDSADAAAKAGGPTKFSDTENVKVPGDRDYKRMTRQKFEEDSELNEGAGSLWVMEGQGAYLFSQNQMRTIGDLLNVKIEGSPKAQLQTKVRVISKLLERLEAPTVRGLASQPPPAGAAPGAAPPAATDAAAGADGKTPKDGAAKTPVAGEAAVASAEPPKGETPFSVQVVPTRIVEQLKDGSYRVRGMQPFMIGKREYKVIVTGVVRPEDFDDAGIDSTRLLDSQFDIVSSKRGAAM
jgi:flagellar L-ring protein precursor FlgH